jgi:hypothetical protein
LDAQTVTVTNVPENGYLYSFFPGDCPAGFNIPSGQYPSSIHLERPHAIYNHTTDQWVLYAHYENSNYTVAEVMVATSASECGPYTVQSAFQPEGYQSRDENIFEDDDGSAYLISASNKYGGANDTMAIFKLASDYLSVDSSAGVTWLFDYQYREAPAVAKSNGSYFLITSQAAGWFPSQGGYAVSSAMMSGWSSLMNLGNASTFGGQSSDILTIKGTHATTFVLVLDHLGGYISYDSGSMWLPLLLNGNAKTATLNWYSSWKVDMKTGILKLPVNPDVALWGTATASSSLSTNPAKLASDGNYGTEWVSATSGCNDSSCFPAWWMTDLGWPQPVAEVDISWYMVKGSEAYYEYKISYSNDGVNFKSIDRTSNQFYGFTSDPVNFTARYVRIDLVNAVLQNNPNNNWYTPQLWEVQLVSAPERRGELEHASVEVTASPSSITIDQPVTATVTVSGPRCAPVPIGTVTLAGGGYVSPALALLDSVEAGESASDDERDCHRHASRSVSQTFTIPGGALVPGTDVMTATYTPALLNRETYGTASGEASVSVNGGGPGGGYLIPNGTYTFINRNSGLAMEDPGSSNTPGANIDQYTSNGGNNQKWQLTNVGDNNVKLICVSSGLALDMGGQSKSPGGTVDQWPWNGGNNQIWHIISLGGSYYEITNLNSGLALEVPGQSTALGTWLDQWTWNGGTNQQWSVQ